MHDPTIPFRARAALHHRPSRPPSRPARVAGTLALAVAVLLSAPPASAQAAPDMHASMKSMAERMAAAPMSGNPDVDFARMMRIHHEGAVDMAQAQLRDGRDPQMRRLAQEIIAAQKKEIAQMDRFLARHGAGTAAGSLYFFSPD